MTRRVFRNLGANSSAMAVTIVGQLALVPVFLSRWDHAAYVDWLVFMTVPSILFVLNGGLGMITGVQLSLHITRGERAAGVIHFRRMMGLFLVMGTLFLGGARVPQVGDGVYWLLNPGTVARPEFSGILLLLAIYLTLTMLQTVVRGIYRANEVEYLGISLQAAGRLFEYAAIALVVLLGGTMEQAFSAMVAAAVVTTVVLTVQSQRLPRRISLLPLWPTWPAWRFFLVDGLPVIAVQAGTRCSQQGMLLLLNHLLDARAVLLVGTLQTVQRALSQIPMTLSWAHAPDLTTAFARNNGRSFGRLVSTATVFSLGAALAAGAGVVLFGPWLYGLWVSGANLDPSRGYFLLLALDTVLLGAWWPLSVMLNAIKCHRRWSWFYVGAVMANLVLAPLLTPSLGAATPFALSLLTGIVMLAFLLRTASRLLRETFAMGLPQVFALFPWRPGRPPPSTDAEPGGDAMPSSPPSHNHVAVSRVPCSEQS